jgi:hypothetical protein
MRALVLTAGKPHLVFVVTPVKTSKYISFMASEGNGKIERQKAEIPTKCFFALLLHN